MFNTAAFSKMKPTSVFVNVARGGIVQQEALVDALVNKRIYAAGLDVMSPEPLPIDSILLKLENVGKCTSIMTLTTAVSTQSYYIQSVTYFIPFVVLMPHLGSATIKTREAMAILAAQNVIKGLAGEKMICPV